MHLMEGQGATENRPASGTVQLPASEKVQIHASGKAQLPTRGRDSSPCAESGALPARGKWITFRPRKVERFPSAESGSLSARGKWSASRPRKGVGTRARKMDFSRKTLRKMEYG